MLSKALHDPQHFVGSPGYFLKKISTTSGKDFLFLTLCFFPQKTHHHLWKLPWKRETMIVLGKAKPHPPPQKKKNEIGKLILNHPPLLSKNSSLDCGCYVSRGCKYILIMLNRLKPNTSETWRASENWHSTTGKHPWHSRHGKNACIHHGAFLYQSWRWWRCQEDCSQFKKSHCSAFLVIQPTNRCIWKRLGPVPTRKIMPFTLPIPASASLSNILMIAIDLGCVNEPGSASMIVSELMERQMFQQNLDPPKGFKFQPPRPWEDSGLQVLYIYIYM